MITQAQWTVNKYLRARSLASATIKVEHETPSHRTLDVRKLSGMQDCLASISANRYPGSISPSPRVQGIGFRESPGLIWSYETHYLCLLRQLWRPPAKNRGPNYGWYTKTSTRGRLNRPSICETGRPRDKLLLHAVLRHMHRCSPFRWPMVYGTKRKQTGNCRMSCYSPCSTPCA